MIGLGQVSEWFRDAVVHGDDEVALIHMPAQGDFTPLSEPLVNIRATLLQAVAQAMLTPDDYAQIVGRIKATHFTKRSFDHMDADPLIDSWPSARKEALRQWVRDNRVDIKRIDAVAALQMCADHRERPGSDLAASVTGPVSPIMAMQWEQGATLRIELPGAGGHVPGSRVLDAVKQNFRLWAMLSRRVAANHFVKRWSLENGIGLPPERLVDFACRRRSMKPDEGQPSWLYRNGLTPVQYRQLLADRALIWWLMGQGPEHFGLSGNRCPGKGSNRIHQSRNAFVAAWARQNGICLPDRPALPLENGHAAQALADWVIRQGPGYFGFVWVPDVVVFQELQFSGRASRIAMKTGAGVDD